MLQTISTSTIGTSVNTISDVFTLDHRGRIVEQKKSINGEPAKIIVQNSYNQMGQLLSEKIGVNESNSLQKLDYLYNIRGWMRGLNYDPETSDLFAMQLYYTEALSNLVITGNTAMPNYNGNISGMKWTNKNLGNTWKAYGFKYDRLNRLNDAIYGEYTQAGSNINLGYSGAEFKDRFNESGITYDLNGNIKTLNRRGIDNPVATTLAYSDIDQLAYSYTGLGNKLLKLDDARPDITGRGDFSEKTTIATEYYYDRNGNLTRDDNKGITNIAYNHLNLPKQVNFSVSNDYIKYIYDANGAKLRKVLVKGGTVQFTENYMGGFVYKTSGASSFSPSADLQYVLAEKGRLVKNGNALIYEYHIKDHLGNTRVVFTDVNGNGTIENNEIPQYSDYYPFGMMHNRTASLTDDNRMLYNGKEFQSETFSTDGVAGDELLFDWYDYGARFYDPQIGRWHSIDPLADRYVPISPYCYVANNPIILLDPDGKKIRISGYNRKETQQHLEIIYSTARGREIIDALEKSKTVYKINGGTIAEVGRFGSRYKPSLNRVTYRNTESSEVDGQTFSPYMVLGHELYHAYQDEKRMDYGNDEGTQIRKEKDAMKFGNYLSDVFSEGSHRTKYGGVNRFGDYEATAFDSNGEKVDVSSIRSYVQVTEAEDPSGSQDDNDNMRDNTDVKLNLIIDAQKILEYMDQNGLQKVTINF